MVDSCLSVTSWSTFNFLSRFLLASFGRRVTGNVTRQFAKTDSTIYFLVSPDVMFQSPSNTSFTGVFPCRQRQQSAFEHSRRSNRPRLHQRFSHRGKSLFFGNLNCKYAVFFIVLGYLRKWSLHRSTRPQWHDHSGFLANDLRTEHLSCCHADQSRWERKGKRQN